MWVSINGMYGKRYERSESSDVIREVVMNNKLAGRIGRYEGLHGSKSGRIAGGVRVRDFTMWRLGFLVDSLANGVAKRKTCFFDTGFWEV